MTFKLDLNPHISSQPLDEDVQPKLPKDIQEFWIESNLELASFYLQIKQVFLKGSIGQLYGTIHMRDSHNCKRLSNFHNLCQECYN